MKQSHAMDTVGITTIRNEAADFPDVLRHIPQPPKQLFVKGVGLASCHNRPVLAVVGSRKITPYGKSVTLQLVEAVAQAGVIIVSGLALGVDAAAHRAALNVGGITVAVLAGGLDTIYPATNHRLAQEILQQGGALVSEYPPGATTYPANFVARNRLVSGLSSAVLITEAAEKSGSLHTANFALEQGREVMAVPGNITSAQSIAANRLIQNGATAVTCPEDILHVLGIEPRNKRKRAPKGSTTAEQIIIDLLVAGESDGAQLVEKSGLEVVRFNQALTMLEITGKIRSLGNNQWSL